MMYFHMRALKARLYERLRGLEVDDSDTMTAGTGYHRLVGEPGLVKAPYNFQDNKKRRIK